MKNIIKFHFSIPNLLLWSARILSVASTGIMLLFFVGEGFNVRLKASEYLLFLFFPIGIYTGMIIAWWKENIGGFITIGSFVMFYIIQYSISGRFPNGWTLLLFTIPGFLFLLYWLITIREKRIHTS